MKISVIGKIMLDKYIQKGTVNENYGGILYDISILSVLFNKKAEIIPISLINQKHYSDIKKIIDKYDNVDYSSIVKYTGDMDTFEMYYDKDGSYYNSLCYFNKNKIPFSSIKPHLDSDIFVISYMTGNDISLDVLKKIAKSNTGLIYGDIHNYIYELPYRGIKTFKTIENWEEWVDCFDIIQGSSFEWEFLLRYSPYHKNVKELLQYSPHEIHDHFQPVANHILKKTRPKILILTDGKYGAHVFYLKDRKVRSIYESALHLEKVEGITGCGDSFLGAFLYKYVQTKKIKRSLRFAVQISSWKTQFVGLWTKGYMSRLKKRFYLDFG